MELEMKLKREWQQRQELEMKLKRGRQQRQELEMKLEQKAAATTGIFYEAVAESSSNGASTGTLSRFAGARSGRNWHWSFEVICWSTGHSNWYWAWNRSRSGPLTASGAWLDWTGAGAVHWRLLELDWISRDLSSRQKKEKARLGTSLSWGRVSGGWRALDGWWSPEENVRTDFSTRFLAYLCDSSAVAYDAHQLCWSRISGFCLARVVMCFWLFLKIMRFYE